MIEEEYSKILQLAGEAKSSGDETERELFRDLLEAAYKYMSFRLYWNVWTPKEKDENNNYRTSAHNRAMDALNILLRYEKSLGKDVPDISMLGRKEIGDMLCNMVADFANRQR